MAARTSRNRARRPPANTRKRSQRGQFQDNAAKTVHQDAGSKTIVIPSAQRLGPRGIAPVMARLSDRGHTLMHVSYEHDVDFFHEGATTSLRGQAADLQASVVFVVPESGQLDEGLVAPRCRSSGSTWS